MKMKPCARRTSWRLSSLFLTWLATPILLISVRTQAQESVPPATPPATNPAQSAEVPPRRHKRSPAQDAPRFQPPHPPEQEFEDPSDDDFDVGDQPNRPPPPPPGGQTPVPATPPVTDFKPPTTPAKTEPTKVRFQIVDGAFYEKGKRRGRAPINKKQ
jgi:hypothetical protein